ncbi:MAG: hypothetical protein LC642_08125 [Verrucomicrobiaceae bacterium]|nr:hypothetical protein [Verrucomicrobiaceae bacterium]
MAAQSQATIQSAGRSISAWRNYLVCDSPGASARTEMVVDEFVELCEAAPFRSFEVFLSDGRSFAVNHPDFIAVDGGAETATIYDEKSNFADVIDIFAIVSVRHEVAA